jgi:hypothetical protein
MRHAGLRVERDATRDSRWDYLDNGPMLQGQWRVDADLRTGAFGSLSRRWYVARTSDDARTDLVTQGELWVERDVGLRWNVRAAAGLTRPSRRGVFARTSTTGSTSSAFACRRCASGARTSSPLGSHGCRGAAYPRTGSRPPRATGSRRTPSPATCASSRTPWSGRSSSRGTTSSRRVTSTGHFARRRRAPRRTTCRQASC